MVWRRRTLARTRLETALLEQMGDGVIILDEHDQVSYINPAAARRFGMPVESILGEKFADLLAHDPQIVEKILQADKNGTEICLDSNPQVCLDVRLSLLTDKNGKHTRKLLVCRDVTLVKQLEQTLRMSENRFRSLLDSAPDAIVITDQTGKIELINQQTEALFGYSSAELVGQQVEILIPSRFHDSHKNQREAYAAGKLHRPRGASKALTGKRKDGSEIPVEIGLSPLETPSGMLVTAIMRDVSERLKVEEQLRLQGTALESAANGVVITNREGKIIWVNPAFTSMTGYSIEEALGQEPRILKSGKHLVDLYKNLWDTLLAGNVWQGELVNRRKDGSLYFEEQTIAPVLDTDGQVTHFVAIKQDITLRKQAEEELRRSNLMLVNHLAEIEALESKLREQAIRDGLTGLYNRRFLDETLNIEIARANREGGLISLVMLDIDHFKLFNDQYGHDVGDCVLQQLGTILTDNIRQGDYACRFGGEEFVVVMPGASLETARERAESICRYFAAMQVPHGEMRLSATLSVGVASYPFHGSDRVELFRSVDQALYAAKAAGRNRVVTAEWRLIR